MASTDDKPKDQGSFDIALIGAENGKVVTRFPPEPSGYLHIGHAKAALLNQYFANHYQGKLIIRFDDTNPSKEKDEFETSIKADLLLLGIEGDVITHTSDHFDLLYDYAIKIINKGLAYVDDTDQETMRDQRMKGIASKNRNLSIEENLRLFQEMIDGTEFGLTACLRAKMSVDDNNKALRDPVIYRCNLTPHHRTGSKYKVYPTYDFACPVVDSIEGVTHALRTNEYRDRNPQYDWFLNALELRKVHIWDFSRINFIYTLLSKRKLQWFVDQDLVTGWDDPRFPTVRGIRRRGMTIEALKQYILMQGASQASLMLEWDKLWALNKKTIDPIAPRFVSLNKDNLVPVTINGHVGSDFKELPRHKKNPDVGNKTTYFGSKIYLEQVDAATVEQDEEITLMDWGNAVVKEIVKNDNGVVTAISMDLHLEGDFKKTKKKITWLANNEHLVNCQLCDFDYLITKKKLEEKDDVKDFVTKDTEFIVDAIADHNIKTLVKGDIIQFERKGYYILDVPSSDTSVAKFIAIPDGSSKSVASKAELAQEAAKKASGGDKPVNSKKADKKADKKAEKKAKKAAKSESASGPTEIVQEDGIAKNLKHLRLKCMYHVQPLYKGLKTPAPKECCSMYQVNSYY